MVLLITIQASAPLSHPATEEALCPMLLEKLRRHEAITPSEQAYRRNWCAQADPFIWDL